MHACMFISADTWRFKAPSETKMVPYDSPLNNTLFGREMARMWCLTIHAAREFSSHWLNTHECEHNEICKEMEKDIHYV